MNRNYVLAMLGLALGVLATSNMRAGYANEATTEKGLADKIYFLGMAVHLIDPKTSLPGKISFEYGSDTHSSNARALA